MEKQIIYDTPNLVCRPVNWKEDFLKFSNYVRCKPYIRKDFNFGETFAEIQSWWNIVSKESVNALLLDKNQGYLIGFINGYVYNQFRKEIQIEFFLPDNLYQSGLASDLLTRYMQYCISQKHRNFRFAVYDTEIDIILVLKNLGAKYYKEECFVYEGRKMLVYKIQNTL